MATHPPQINLLDLRPKRNVPWEEGEQGQVVLLLPKFRNKFLARWLLPYLAKPNFRIKLDSYGSFLWKSFDGTTRLEEVGERMKKEFGDHAEPICDRIAKFLRTLEKDKFVTVDYGHINNSL